MSMRKLIDLSKEEQDNFLNSFDVMLADIDGVLFRNIDNVIEGAADAVKNLRLLGKKVRFVTNNSFASIEEQVERFKDFEAKKSEYIRPSVSMILYLKRLNFDKTIYVVGLESMKNDLEEAGFKVVFDEVKSVPESGEGWGSIVKNLNPDVGAVVIDFTVNFSYTHIQRCIEYIKYNKAIYLLGAADQKGHLFNTTVVSAGPFANIVTDFTGVSPEVLGKPGEALKKVLNENLGLLDPRRVIFIGDAYVSLVTHVGKFCCYGTFRVDVDLGFAAKCGYQKVLTLTGTTRPEELDDWKYDETFKPDYVLDTIKDLEVVTNRKLQE